MKQERRALLVGSCLVGILNVAAVGIAVPHLVQIMLGASIVFIVPGFALVCAVLPERQFSRGERLLASVGMSLALATGATVLLGATPIGLTRLSLAVVLAVCTLTLSIYSIWRAGGLRGRRGHEVASKETGS
jgi:uncharacterized membrane protein